MLALSETEFSDLRSKTSTAKFAKTRVVPNAFTEKGLYMLAQCLRIASNCLPPNTDSPCPSEDELQREIQRERALIENQQES